MEREQHDAQEQEHDEERARCLAEQEREHDEGGAQRLKQVGCSAYQQCCVVQTKSGHGSRHIPSGCDGEHAYDQECQWFREKILPH